MRYGIIFTLSVLLFIACDIHGQWTKVIEDDRAVYWQYVFDEADQLPTFGYMTVGNYPRDSNTIFQTIDGGFTWKQIPFTTDYPQAISLCVKNRSTAWVFRNQPYEFEIYSIRTIDGGNTWDTLPIRRLFIGSSFNKHNNLLIANGGDYKTNKSYRSLSTDNGDSWTDIEIINEGRQNIHFFDSLSGFETGIENGPKPYPAYINRTTDGGLTWLPSSKKYESCWAGVAIKNTKIGFLCSSYSQSVLRTVDGGATWDTTHVFSNTGLSGTIVGDLCHLYIQTGFAYRQGINDDKYGLFESTDQGVTWIKIANIGAQPGYGMYFRNNVLFVSYRGDQNTPVEPNALWRYQLPPIKPTIVAPSIVLSLKECEIVDTIISIAAINQCDGEKVILDTVFTRGSSAFNVIDNGTGREIYWDTLRVKYKPNGNTEDTSFVHLRFTLKGNSFDTVMRLLGSYKPPRTAFLPTVSDTSLLLETAICFGKEQTVYYSILDSCIGVKGELVSSTVTGSTNFQVTADADSAIVIYNGAGYDTAKLALKFRLYEYEYDTVITLYGYPSATKDSLSFLATLTKPSVTWQETTELRVLPDKAAVNKNLSEIRFDVTLDADVLEPLTNYSTGIAGAAITIGNPTPIGKLMRFPFTITGNNMTLDPAVIILNLPMRPYVSDTTITTINVSTINLNPQDPDYERCTLSATGNGTPFSLELMCGDSLLSRHLGGKPILTITSLKPNPTKADVTVTFDLAGSGAVQAEVLDVLGNVVKQETLEATQGETKYIISLPDSPEGVYYVRLRYGTQTRTAKFVRE